MRTTMKIKENPPKTLRTARQFLILTLQKFLRTYIGLTFLVICCAAKGSPPKPEDWMDQARKTPPQQLRAAMSDLNDAMLAERDAYTIGGRRYWGGDIPPLEWCEPPPCDTVSPDDTCFSRAGLWMFGLITCPISGPCFVGSYLIHKLHPTSCLPEAGWWDPDDHESDPHYGQNAWGSRNWRNMEKARKDLATSMHNFKTTLNSCVMRPSQDPECLSHLKVGPVELDGRHTWKVGGRNCVLESGALSWTLLSLETVRFVNERGGWSESQIEATPPILVKTQNVIAPANQQIGDQKYHPKLERPLIQMM